MKKIYQLTAENKKPERVLEAIKNEIRKYMKRERRKKLPEGMNVWNIDCKFGQNDEEPKEILLPNLTKCIDEAAESNCESIYVELLSSAIKKKRKDDIIIKNKENEENNKS